MLRITIQRVNGRTRGNDPHEAERKRSKRVGTQVAAQSPGLSLTHYFRDDHSRRPKTFSPNKIVLGKMTTTSNTPRL